MRALIALAFLAAAGGALLSYVGWISATSLVPAGCFAVGLVLVLLHLIAVSDRRY